ncbi:LamG domain-containing protein [Pseudobacter ginsenosidimutans]|nr:LamG domain-containing protein [Pseudobacter ginsenosidimutans]
MCSLCFCWIYYTDSKPNCTLIHFNHNPQPPKATFAPNKPQLMKIVSWISGSAFALIMLFCTTTPMTSCIKETIRDTVTIKDTITIKDTVTIPCECDDEEDLKRGLIAYYNFNNGTLNDSSGKNNHIVFNNAVKTIDRMGRPNNAYLFNGTSSYMQVTNSESLNPGSEITMMAIMKVNGFYAGQCKSNQIFGKTSYYSDYVNGAYVMRFTPADFICSSPLDTENEVFNIGYGDRDSYPEKSAGAISDTLKVKTDQWYTLIYTYKEGVSKLYVNGKLIDERQHTAVFTPNMNDLFIGKCEGSSYPFWFNGVIDEIRLYERALCETEVKVLTNLAK